MKIPYIFLELARLLPRGYHRLFFLFGTLDASYQCIRITLSFPADQEMYVDLREAVCSPLIKWGCFPHQLVEDEFIYNLVRPGYWVYDVGGSIGHSALIFARAISPGGCVYSFEPSPRSLRLLKLNARLHDNIAVVPEAVSDTGGPAVFLERLELDRSQVVGSSEERVRKLVKGEKFQKISTTKLDIHHANIGRPRVHLLKIDVEGHEPAVLRGARNMIQEWVPIIFFEALSERMRLECEEIIFSLCENEYIVFGFGRSGIQELDKCDRSEITDNYLAVPRWASSRVIETQTNLKGSVYS